MNLSNFHHFALPTGSILPERRNRVLIYLLAVVLPLMTLLLRQSLAVPINEHPLLILFMLPVIVISLLGGFGPGLVATLAVGLETYFILPSPLNFEDLVPWGVLIINSVLVGILSERLRIARKLEFEERKKLIATQAELQLREHQFHDLFKNSPTGMIIIDPKTGYIVQSNYLAQKYYGYSEEELQSKTLEQLTFQDDKQLTRLNSEKLAKGLEENIFLEKRYVRKDGEIFWVQLNIASVKDAGGSVNYLIGSFIDITEKIQAQISQKDSERTYTSLFNNMLNGLAYCQMLYEHGEPQDFVYLNVNSAFETLTGLKDVKGKRVSEVIPGIRETDPGLFEKYNRVATSGIPDQFEIYVAALEMWFSVSVYCPRKEHFVAVFDVITEHKRLQDELLEQRKFLREIIDADPNRIMVMDAQGKFLMVNQSMAAAHDLTPEEMVGRSRYDFSSSQEEAERYRKLDQEVIANRRQMEAIVASPMQGGGIKWYLSIKKPLQRPDGNLNILAVSVDISEIKESQDRLRKLSHVVDQSPESILITDTNARIEYVNEACVRKSGYGREELIGKNPNLLNSGNTPRETFESLWNTLSQGRPWSGEFYNRSKQGNEYVEFSIVAPIRHEGVITHYAAINEDITDKKQTEKRLEQLAHFDLLTGLPNHSLLKDLFKFAVSLAERNSEKLAVMFLDLDHFKNINDTLGHSIGDELLMAVSKRIKSVIREEDIVSRLGGDEFILVIPDTEYYSASLVATKLIEAVSAPIHIEHHDLITTPSIGIALYPDDGQDLETLSKNADVAMYKVKQAGRNDFRFYTQEMQANSARNLQLSVALRNALSLGQLRLYYQPQVSMQDGHLIGAEALLRWMHPELGMISPAEFIPLAESSGLIIPIGEWVLRQAAKQMKIWLDMGFAHLQMAVNLSSVQFRHAKLPERISAILDEVGLPHGYLELELTEAIAMDDPLGAIAVMDELHRRGIRLSIDDFGTGYSSLSYLKKFKVYKLKIDQSFVRDIIDDPDDKAIVSAIINMANSLGMLTIAEGVETSSQLAFLRLQGCHEAQGYLFSKPVPADQFEIFATQTRDLSAHNRPFIRAL